jgi:type II secretory pathway component PulC
MKENISPEEKLLRLIRGPKKQASLDVKPPGTGGNLRTDLKQSAFALIRQRLSLPYKNFLSLQKIIVFSFIVSGAYLIISLIYPLIFLKKIELPTVTQGKTREVKIAPSEEIKPYDFYKEAVGNRKIFGGALSQEASIPASSANIDIMKDINLVGIITGDNPQAVIEDKKTQKTYYVNKGQFIGEVLVENILEGKIIVSYKGQRYELYL